MAFVSYFSLIYSRGTYKTSTRKTFGPTKIPTRNSLDPQYTHEKKLRTDEGTTPTTLTMARDPRNLAHSFLKYLTNIVKLFVSINSLLRILEANY